MKSILSTIAAFAILFSFSISSAEMARPGLSRTPILVNTPKFIVETIKEQTFKDAYDKTFEECNEESYDVAMGQDTDHDGITDWIERSVRKRWIAEGFTLTQVWVYDPVNADCRCDDTLTCWNIPDTDHDGIADGSEIGDANFWNHLVTLSGDEPIEDRIVHPQDSIDSDNYPDVRDADSDDDGIMDGMEDRSPNFDRHAASYYVRPSATNIYPFRDIHDNPVECELDDYAEESWRLGTAFGYFMVERYGEEYWSGVLECRNETVMSEYDFNGMFDQWRDVSDARTPDTDGDGFCDGDGPGCEGLELNDRCPTIIGDEYGCPSADTDGDGVKDYEEQLMGTDPNNPDTDGDGLWDGVEDANHDGVYEPLEGESDPLNADTDGDGLNDGREHQLGTNPSIYDTDGDGIADGLEDANRDGQHQSSETDPLNPDTDGDGLSDGFEDANHDGIYQQLVGESDPRDPDSDKDGISDGHEASGCVVDPTC